MRPKLNTLYVLWWRWNVTYFSLVDCPTWWIWLLCKNVPQPQFIFVIFIYWFINYNTFKNYKGNFLPLPCLLHQSNPFFTNKKQLKHKRLENKAPQKCPIWKKYFSSLWGLLLLAKSCKTFLLVFLTHKDCPQHEILENDQP